jgi:hypothetical protein
MENLQTGEYPPFRKSRHAGMPSADTGHEAYVETVERIIERMEAEGMSDAELQRRVRDRGVKVGKYYMRDLKRGVGRPDKRGYPKDDKLRAIAAVLRTSVAYLRGASDDPTATDDEPNDPSQAVAMDTARPANLRSTIRQVPLPDVGERTVPIRKVTGGAKGGIILMAEDPVDYAPRPPALAAAQDAWAYRNSDPTMAPAFEIDDPVYVVPSRPWSTGNYALVTMGGEAFLRRVDRLDETAVWLEQFTPPQVQRVARARIDKIERVLRHAEVLAQ